MGAHLGRAAASAFQSACRWFSLQTRRLSPDTWEGCPGALACRWLATNKHNHTHARRPPSRLLRATTALPVHHPATPTGRPPFLQSFLPERVGYQCSAYYREVVIPAGLVLDARFRLTRGGRAVYVG